MMTYSDLLVIYLTCGAPLGVLYFFQNRQKQKGVRLWIKTLFTFILWMPFGYRLLMSAGADKKSFPENLYFKKNETQGEIFSFRKQLEEISRTSHAPISIFELREVFERYVGLTIAKNCENIETNDAEKEIFRLTNGKNSEIGAICLNRRNLKRLTFHQIQARQDFFQIIRQLKTTAADKVKFANSVAGFFQLLKDGEAQSTLEKMFSDSMQNERDFNLDRSENQLWNTEIRQSQSAKVAALRMRSLTAAANNLSGKD